MNLYNCKSSPEPGAYIITKFTSDLEVESSYLLSQSECPCPRGAQGHPCRHRKMLSIFKQFKHINDGWFLDFDTRIWHSPPPPADDIVREEGASFDAPDAEEPPVEVKRTVEAPEHSPSVPTASGAPRITRRRVVV